MKISWCKKNLKTDLLTAKKAYWIIFYHYNSHKFSIKSKTTNEAPQQSENKILLNTFWKDQLINIKAQVQFFRTTTGIKPRPDTFEVGKLYVLLIYKLWFYKVQQCTKSCLVRYPEERNAHFLLTFCQLIVTETEL